MALMERETDLKTAAEDRYVNYALSVITQRALPDVRDGLKPVQRRILFAMFHNLHLGPGNRPRKSAAVVGEVLGKYHPHGDQAAYEAMVRMAQPFALRYPLVHGEGNFGSLDGDSAAAMRYTEARLTPIAEEMLRDLDAETVALRANYDATLDEPVVLPAAIPQLLMNGSTGIAVGMATNIPPHNLREIVQALVAMIDEPDIDTKGLLKHIKGPDFPTGGVVMNARREIRAVYESGQGAIRLRARWTEEKGARGKCLIVINEIPYTVNKAQLVEAIAVLIIGRKLPQVVDVRDESTDVVRIVLELKADAPAELAMAYLFRHTDLQVNFNVNLTCLTPTKNPAVGQPARVALRDLCRQFLDFRLEVVTRRLEHEKRKLEERLHILDGLVKVYGDLDKALRIIRRAASREDAATKLKAAFKLDDVQANAILEIRLYQLARLEIERIEAERAAKRARVREIEDLLKRPARRWKLIRDELVQIGEKYGDARRTTMTAGEEIAYDPNAYIVHEDTTVVLSRDGWIKRVRELKDPTSTRLREGDALFAVLAGNTRDRLALFSSSGSLYVMKINDVPATTGYGEPVQSLLKFGDGERVVAAQVVPGEGDGAAQDGEAGGDEDAGEGGEGGGAAAARGGRVGKAGKAAAAERGRQTGPGGKARRGHDDARQGRLFAIEGGKGAGRGAREEAPAAPGAYLVATARGYGFRFQPDLGETTRAGRRVARVGKDDEVVAVTPLEGKAIVCATAKGKMLRFDAGEAAELSGPGRGVIFMRLDAGDRVVGALAPPEGERMIALSPEGREHRLRAADVPAGHRGGKGQKVVKRGGVAVLRPEPREGNGARS
jgi:DNA gyrase subunit A